MKLARSWKWVSAAVICAVIGAFEYLNFTDFCYSEWRYLGDAGLIDAAIAHEISHVPSAESQHVLKYATVAAFHDDNPICCRMEKWGIRNLTPDRRRRIWMRRIIGEYFIIVELWYRLQDSGPRPFAISHYLIDSCGRIREPFRDRERGGTRITKEGGASNAATREWEQRRWASDNDKWASPEF